MEGPDPRVVGVELDNHVSTGAQHLRVAALGVLGVNDGVAVPMTFTLVQDEHIVAVEMHWLMRY